MLSWNDIVVSLSDDASKVYKLKVINIVAKTQVISTIFDNTKLGLKKWFLAMRVVTSHQKGILSPQLSWELDITQKSALFMLQRIKTCFGIENSNELDKKAGGSQGINSKDKTPVWGWWKEVQLLQIGLISYF